MSGKPASVGASRAGVPGAPRVLVYVADPRQLEPGAVAPDPPPAAPPPSHLDTLYLPENLHQVALPRNTLYKTHVDGTDHKNSNTVFYKSMNDVNGKLNIYNPSDNLTHRPEFIPVSQQFVKDQSFEKRVDDRKVHDDLSSNDKPESSVVSAVEAFQSRIPLDAGELTTYQRCTGPIGPESVMSSMHQVALQHGQNQFSESVTVQSGSEGSNSGDRELSRSYVNYQFLEQSVSHQSIVNQSISILNQQVGVSRGIISEGESGGAPQLVRTADGVVLAVLPSSVLPQPAESTDLNSRTALSEIPQTIVVPLGWRRIINGSSVLYISPSGTALSTLPQLREYLQTAGTCKCGLPCPLRPETAFSFDPKVPSKPYQASAGAELTKLCNHKRKLLATLQARAHSPATPPPNLDQTKGTTAEVAVLKKKMKKRTGFPPNMTSHLMVQRERPLSEYKPQDNDHNRTISPNIGPQRPNNGGQSCLPTFAPMQQNVLNAIPQDNDAKQETHVQRSSHYLTVNSGWITQQQQDNLDGQKPNQSSTGPPNTSINLGLPVLGTNGQVIGVNTAYKQNANYKNVMGVMSQSVMDHDSKDDKKDTSAHQSNQPAKNPTKEEESQIFCGLNQPLTPEVMQKINEQQQIFIQQNQKQIEMAMKGYRTQLENVNQNKTQNQSQYVPQGQLVIQNGAVVKTNPAKTPPWQVKRTDTNTPNPMASPNYKPQKSENIDYEDSNTNTSDDSIHSYNSFPNNETSFNQAMCSRVPPLPQHYNMLNQQWPNMELNKKKTKNNSKVTKKKGSPTENKVVTFGSNGVRIISDSKSDMPNNSIPSFMDDPSGYLAQQTVLLNNTISRQVGINSTYDVNQFEGPNNCYGLQSQGDKSCKPKSCEVPNTYRSNVVPNASPSPNNTPDSSVLSDKGVENSIPCCKGCNISIKGNGSDFSESQMRLKYMKQNAYKMEMDGASATSSSKNSFEDNPVTSSTFMERSPILNDSCGPIQAGTVSTSNVSPTEALQPPEPSPTLSNSSRSTDTPHSSGGNNSQIPSNCSYPMPSPAYSNPGSCKENFNSNPSTPGGGQIYPYNSPGPPNSTQSISGTQMMHFISNHNVNKNLMEVDNISMVGVKPGLKHVQETLRSEIKRRMENTMPGYCPPPHLGGGPAHSLIQACYVQTFVTTMASGFSVTRDTVTSVLAGKANTNTTSINASQANFVRPPPPPSVNLATTYAIPNNQPDPFINSVNLPTSYPLHIAGTTAQNMISKSPLEMVQHVIGSLPSKPETSSSQTTTLSQITRRTGPTNPGQILISSTGQIIVSNSQMPPPPPKTTTAVSPVHASSAVTNVSTSLTQVVPAVGGVQPMVNQPTVVVNTLPAPFVIQPPMMAVDGQVVQQNAVLPQIVTGGIVSGQSPSESPRQIDVKSSQNFVQGVAMLSPESLKKRNKKKKAQPTNITNVLQIAAPQQNPNNLMVHHSSPQHNTSPQFSPRGFQLSPNNNISPTPMLQALTIVPGKSGTPAHIVMNGQGNTNNFGSQQIITNTSPSQQINLLQPVNLINNASSVMPNFPAFQQFIVPNLGGMVMTADGTAIIQDNSTGMPMQLQLQTVNGQNVLTPVQNPGVFTGANGGVVIRAQNQQGKIIQSQHSPGAQFLSPNSQVMMNSPNFNGQLSPLLANLSPPNVAFNANPQVRSGNVQSQEFIQANQMGQVMVPLSPKQVSIASASTNRGSSTFVQQNTTIVQQQTTLVSNSHNTQISSNSQGTPSRLSIDPNVLLTHKQIKRNFLETPPENQEEGKEEKAPNEGDAKSEEYGKFMNEFGGINYVRHSVSTQTLVNQQRGKSPSQAVSGSSPPDTTTHSPLGALEPAASPRVYGARCVSTQGNYADTTTKSPEPADANSSAMVQCVSSSEQDIAESREHMWPTPRNDFGSDNDQQNMMSNLPMMRQNRPHNPVESTELHYNQNTSNTNVNHQQNLMPMASNYYDRQFTNKQTYKRKNDFGDGPTFRNDKIMRTNYGMVHGLPKESNYDNMGMGSPEKTQSCQFPVSGTSSDVSAIQKVFDRHDLGSDHDANGEEPPGEEKPAAGAAGGGEGARSFEVGDLVWGPVRGFASWPGKLTARAQGAVGAEGAEGAGWWVRWFGGGAASLVGAARLLTLSEGLEAHHAARTKHRKSRKLNTLLENAIQEAMSELDKKSDGKAERRAPVAGDPPPELGTITETPRRSRKHDKVRNKEKHHKKKASSSSKSGDSTRLRSAR